jgi:hypothetical protein
MPNQIDSSGIQVKTYTEVVAALTGAFQLIYGADINLDQNTPDGQLINLLALMITDQGDLIVQDYDSKDPDQAVGVALDGVSQLCGITRKGGTYTLTNIVVTTDRSLNLNGMDTATPFTVSDATGNLFQLIASASLTTGENTLAFQAVSVGNIQVTTNTINIASTVVLGVVSVNNPTAPTSTGVDQETDSVMRLRRQASVSLPSQANLQGLIGGLNTVDGLLEAIVYENTEDTESYLDHIPAHGIWVIVNGGTDADVAAMIYRYRPLGCPMKGTTDVDITQVDSSTFTVSFDRAEAQDLYVEFTATSKSGGTIDSTSLKNALAAAWSFLIYEAADITTLNSLVHTINPDLIVTSAGVSITEGSYASSVLPTDKFNYFTLSSANISVTT